MDDIKLILDGRCVECGATTPRDLLEGHPEGTIAIVNGRHVDPGSRLKDGDSVYLMEGGRGFVTKATETLLSQRYSRPVYEKLSGIRIGVAGLGGIGSHVAEALVRAGVGHLVIADFDRVDQTNLSRQNYFDEDIGKGKAEATASILRRIRPDADIVPVDVRLTPGNVCSVFSGCNIVCEAFDRSESKSMLVESLLMGDPRVTVVSCSGMAGFGSSNTIVTERRMSRLYICGDGESDADSGEGLVASRVMVCAGHVANMAVRLAIGRSEP